MGPNGLPLPDFIRIDVEDAEVEVLEGASGTLAGGRPALVIERHSTNAPVLAALRKHGYHAGVLRSDIPVSEVKWDANILTVPGENSGLRAAAAGLTHGLAAA